MRKYAHQILFIIIFFLIGLIFYQQSSSKKDHLNKKLISQNKSDLDINNSNLRLDFKEKINIAYVNSDTVSKYYEYAKKIQAKISIKRLEAENQIKSKYLNYENLVKDFEKASPIMGDREKMEKAQKIRMLEQEIIQVEQKLAEKITKEELNLTEQYIFKTNEFMQLIGNDLGYDYIMSYRTGGAMLYAKKKHDITNKIIELLNQSYESSN